MTVFSPIESPAGVARTGVAYAEANWGRWIARCPRPWCTNAMAVSPGQPWFRCDGPGGCGWVARLSWPADPEAIEALLLMRPVERTRNWLPGETLETLLAENAAHDVLPPAWRAMAEAAPGGVLELFGTTDGVVTSGVLLDALPAGRSRLAIGPR